MGLNKLLNAVAGAALFASIVGCSDATFKSGVEGGQAVSPPPGQQIPGLPNALPTRPLDNDQGGIKYSLCTALPKGGYAPLGACAVNEVMVIINDGKADGRTCCPIGDGILSKIPGEVNQEKKEGLCGPDEVATGIKAMTVPYCTKINTQSFSLEPAGGAVYGTKASAGLLGKLAAQYNIGDCCACPEGTVMIGKHTQTNNFCSDQCVKIVPKLK